MRRKWRPGQGLFPKALWDSAEAVAEEAIDEVAGDEAIAQVVESEFGAE